ncbi:hypothetical protein [Euzebya sp.]|uniref:hypothetical protein n=1 Tax=Euzebya sp. TaxID=1971409 RepID=UPI003516130A
MADPDLEATSADDEFADDLDDGEDLDDDLEFEGDDLDDDIESDDDDLFDDDDEDDDLDGDEVSEDDDETEGDDEDEELEEDDEDDEDDLEDELDELLEEDEEVQPLDEEEGGAKKGAKPRRKPELISDDEFTCRSCFLVKKPSQLADAEQMLCFDCV